MPPPDLSRLTPSAVVGQLRHIPSAPRVLPPLKRLLVKGDCSIDEIVALLRLDPGLASRIIQTGNSPYYSRGQRCRTVEEAVGRVGFDRIYELVSNAVAAAVLVRPLVVYSLEADELWLRSVTCAVAADILAEHLSLDRDIAYTVGLLHGVGMVAIDEWALSHWITLQFKANQPAAGMASDERASLGFDHTDVGYALLRQWNYPADMADPIRWQLRPRATGARQPFSSLLHLARHLPLDPAIAAPETPVCDPALLDTLGLQPDALPDIQARVTARLEEIWELLHIEEPVPAAAIDFPGGRRTIASPGQSRPPFADHPAATLSA